MRSYRRSVPRLPRVDVRDYTKSRKFVRFDLLIRTLSALGLLGLGVASWIFQVTSQRAQTLDETMQRQNRKYLPIVRAMTELELTLDDTAAILFQHALEDGNQASVFPELSSRIDSAAIAMQIVGDGHDRNTALELPDLRAATIASKRCAVPIRAAAFMLSDLLRVAAIAQASAPADSLVQVQLVPVRGTKRYRAIVSVNGAPQSYIGLRPEGVPAWRSWIGEEQVELGQIVRTLRAVTREVQRQVVTSISDVIREHPELGDQYVAIRMEVAKSRHPIERTKRTAA